MTRLMVSVRNAEEAEIALAGGAEMIDIKEPTRGALGAANVPTVRSILDRVDGRCPVSVALGELSTGLIDIGDVAGIAYAKVGLAGMRFQSDWEARLASAFQDLPNETHAVAVNYVDVDHAPSSWELLAFARSVGCGTLLFDTYVKDGRSLFESIDDAGLAEIITAASRSNVKSVLAGALTADLVPRAARFRPLAVAVRSAACGPSRDSLVERSNVQELIRRLHNELPAGSR